jgi:hypothetical protein
MNCNKKPGAVLVFKLYGGEDSTDYPPLLETGNATSYRTCNNFLASISAAASRHCRVEPDPMGKTQPLLLLLVGFKKLWTTVHELLMLQTTLGAVLDVKKVPAFKTYW